MAHDHIVQMAQDFWNIRGTFRIAGLLNVGTQSSLVRLKSGKFVLLDAYTLEGAVLDEVMALTKGGTLIEAVCHLHPFHTLHVEPVASLLPHARQYGTLRHHHKAPGITWEPQTTDAQTFHALYKEDFTFTVPRGVAFIPQDEKVHFSSVLAFHTRSGTLHVDDTLVWLDLPLIGGLSFHMTLKGALRPEAGAAQEFRAWAMALGQMCEGVSHLCTAHGKALPPQPSTSDPLSVRVHGALERVEGVLKAHEATYG